MREEAPRALRVLGEKKTDFIEVVTKGHGMNKLPCFGVENRKERETRAGVAVEITPKKAGRESLKNPLAY